MTLKEYCKKRGSQERAAAEIGVTVCHLNRYINGLVKRPHQILLRRLADLGIEVKNEILNTQHPPPREDGAPGRADIRIVWLGVPLVFV